MAHTAIVLSNDDGVLASSLPSVPVVSGDTISFSTDYDGPAYLFFSPAAVAVLSPKPAVPFALSGGTAEFTFSSSSPGAYSVFFETRASAFPPPFPAANSGLLMLEIDSTGVGFGTSDHKPKGGKIVTGSGM